MDAMYYTKNLSVQHSNFYFALKLISQNHIKAQFTTLN